MRQRTRHLELYTWDQAEVMHLATAAGFAALGIHPSTIRRWASQGHIQAVGKAPRGAHLYDITTVRRHARRSESDGA